MKNPADQRALQQRRVSYERDELTEDLVPENPFALFERWLERALEAPDIVEPNAMALATVRDGRPSNRIVLLRGYDERGMRFFTNYESRKGREMAENARAAVVFWWGALERQIRIEGDVAPLPAAESDAYFATRPRGHRLSAWASAQSRPVADRATLDASIARFEQDFEGREVERPPNWGGYVLAPCAFEFWQGRPNRMHDRIAYDRIGREWQRQRLSP